MSTPIVLPKLGMTMEEATLLRWIRESGDSVREGEAIAEVETEKITVDLEAPATGILFTEVAVEDILAVGDRLGFILEAGEEPPEAGQPLPVEESTPAPAPERVVTQATDAPTSELRASPAARAAARRTGVELGTVSGTGPAGRIVAADVEAFAAAAASSNSPKSSPLARYEAEKAGVSLGDVAPAEPGARIMRADVAAAIRNKATPDPSAARADRRVRLSGMRRTIAKNMHGSLQEMAQLTLNMRVDMTEAVELRKGLILAWESTGIRPTYTDFVVKAAALALLEHPDVNSRLEGDELVYLGRINVGLSVALEDGLIVPVIHDADRLSLKETAIKAKELATGARERRLTPDLLEGGTFTVTTLGAWDVESFTPVINPPEAAILGVGALTTEAAFDGDRVVARQVLRLSLSFDHRILDGVPAAAFLRRVRNFLEHPLLLGFQ